jgi:ubiquitin fusion degradation protein 1
METLSLAQGDFVQISNTRLPSGKLIKIQPQSPDFLEITDPRAVLEFTLRQFTTLSPNDCFWINYADHIFKVKVLETEPDPSGILVIETDLNVDFAPPVGYVEPDYSKGSNSAATTTAKSIAHSIGQYEMSPQSGFSSAAGPFTGTGQSLRNSVASGTASPLPTPTTTATTLDPNRPIALKLPKNTMFFGISSAKQPAPSTTPSEDSDSNTSSAFKGKGRSLR